MFQFFGQIAAPSPVAIYGGGDCGGGLIILITNLLRVGVVAAGIFSLFNLLTAGFQWITSNGESKAVQAAGNKIINTIIGLVIVAASFLLAAVLGILIFGNPNAILQPVLFGPTSISGC